MIDDARADPAWPVHIARPVHEPPTVCTGAWTGADTKGRSRSENLVIASCAHRRWSIVNLACTVVRSPPPAPEFWSCTSSPGLPLRGRPG